jgi:16S rRNA (guanine966-N2)-methyltransferase
MIRIVAGRLRGRKLKTCEGKSVRPSSSLVRGVIFNVLGDKVQGNRVLDLFAGSGSLGIEALSRGAGSAVFVETGQQVVQVLRDNLTALGVETMSQVRQEDCLEYLAKSGEKFDLILADPPYRDNIFREIVTLVCQNKMLKPGAVLVIQHHRNGNIDQEPMGLVLWKSKLHGKTRLDFFKQ